MNNDEKMGVCYRSNDTLYDVYSQLDWTKKMIFAVSILAYILDWIDDIHRNGKGLNLNNWFGRLIHERNLHFSRYVLKPAFIILLVMFLYSLV